MELIKCVIGWETFEFIQNECRMSLICRLCIVVCVHGNDLWHELTMKMKDIHLINEHWWDALVEVTVRVMMGIFKKGLTGQKQKCSLDHIHTAAIFLRMGSSNAEITLRCCVLACKAFYHRESDKLLLYLQIWKLSDWSVTEKFMNRENLRGHWTVFQAKTTY